MNKWRPVGWENPHEIPPARIYNLWSRFISRALSYEEAVEIYRYELMWKIHPATKVIESGFFCLQEFKQIPYGVCK